MATKIFVSLIDSLTCACLTIIQNDIEIIDIGIVNKETVPQSIIITKI